MKRLIIAFCLISMLGACNVVPSRIVSETPVDDAILGTVLCEPVSESDVIRAFDRAGMFDENIEKYIYNTETNLMVVPSFDDGISFGGASWDYVDFCKDGAGNLYAVVFENFFDTRHQAEMQYKKIAGVLDAKHGEANFSKSEDSITSMWTDDTNSVGVSVHKDGTDDARGDWTCTFYYVNISLSKAAQ